MFADQQGRSSMTRLSWYVGWERYSWATTLILGVGVAAAVAQLRLPSEATSSWSLSEPAASATAVHASDEMHEIALLMLITAGLHLVSLLSLSVLRDRSVSLQHRPTLLSKIVAITLVVLCAAGSVTLAALCCVRLRRYASDSTNSPMVVAFPSCSGAAGVSTLLLVRPDTHSFLFVVAALFCAWIFVSVAFHVLATMWIIFQRAVFLSPPPGVWDDPEEIKALNWICTDEGDVIPTIYMLPPSVARGHREVGVCMLYSHGNAMDLADTVYTLRALAETFDVAVMGYEYPGYGMCSGSISERKCYSALAAAFQCLTEYHKLTPRQIVVYGRSLGTGPSTHFASQAGRDLGGIVLQSPLMSIVRTLPPFNSPSGGCIPTRYFGDMFCSIEKIASIEVPVFITHGRRDTMVPFSHGEHLWNRLRPEVRALSANCSPLWVDESSHNDMPRPWVMTEEHLSGESEREFQEKLRRNRDARIFIQKLREFLTVVRNHKDSVDKEEEKLRAERREKRAAQKAAQVAAAAAAAAAAESEKKGGGGASGDDAAAALAAAAALGGIATPHDLAVLAAVAAGGGSTPGALDLHAIELTNLTGNGGSPGAGTAGTVVRLPSPNTEGGSSYSGPIIVTGGTAGEEQLKQLLAHKHHSSAPNSAKGAAFKSDAGALGHVGHTPHPVHGGGGGGNHPKNVANYPTHLHEREGLLGHADHQRGGGAGPSAVSSGGNNKHQRSGSLRFSDQQYLAPGEHATGYSMQASDHRLGDETSLGALPERSAADGGVTDRDDGLSPDASRRPSLTENMLSVTGNPYGYTSMIGSVGPGERERERDRDRDRLGSSLNYNPRSDRFMFDRDRERDRERDRDRGLESSRGGDFNSRTGHGYGGAAFAAEVSRIGDQRLHSQAVRGAPRGIDHGPHRSGAAGAGGGGDHSPQSMSRSISISTSMQSPSSFYAHHHYASSAAPERSVLPPINSSSNLAAIDGRATGPTTSNGTPAGGASGSSSSSHTPSLSVSSAIPATASGAASGSPGSAAFSPATILAPNPTLVPLSLAQLQELMDSLKARERAERERVRAQAHREREKDRAAYYDAHSSSSSHPQSIAERDAGSCDLSNEPISLPASADPKLSTSRRPPVHRSSLEKDKGEAFNAAVKESLTGGAAPSGRSSGARDRAAASDSGAADREHSVSVSSVGHRHALRNFNHQHHASHSASQQNPNTLITMPVPRGSSHNNADGAVGAVGPRNSPSPQSLSSPISPRNLDDDGAASAGSAGAGGSMKVEMSGFSGSAPNAAPDGPPQSLQRKTSSSRTSAREKAAATTTTTTTTRGVKGGSPAQVHRTLASSSTTTTHAAATAPAPNGSPPPTASSAAAGPSPSRVVIHPSRSGATIPLSPRTAAAQTHVNHSSSSSNSLNAGASRSATSSPVGVLPGADGASLTVRSGSSLGRSSPPGVGASLATTPSGSPTISRPAAAPSSVPPLFSPVSDPTSRAARGLEREESASANKRTPAATAGGTPPIATPGGSGAGSSGGRDGHHAHFAHAGSSTSSSQYLAPSASSSLKENPNSRFHRGERGERSERDRERGGDRDRDRSAATAGGDANASRVSQHRASVSGYDHTSLMSRSRSGSRWPYSLNNNDAGYTEEEGGEGVGVGEEGSDIAELEEDGERATDAVDHSNIQLVEAGHSSHTHHQPHSSSSVNSVATGAESAFADLPIAVRRTDGPEAGGGGGSPSHSKIPSVARGEASLTTAVERSAAAAAAAAAAGSPSPPLSSSSPSAAAASASSSFAVAASAPASPTSTKNFSVAKSVVVRPGSVEGSAAAAEIKASKAAAAAAAASSSSSGVSVSHQVLSYIPPPSGVSRTGGAVVGRESTTSLAAQGPMGPESPQRAAAGGVVASILQPIADRHLQ